MKYKIFICIYVYKIDKTIKINTFKFVCHISKGYCDRISLIPIQGKSNDENLSNSEGTIKVTITKKFRIITINNKRRSSYTVLLINFVLF